MILNSITKKESHSRNFPRVVFLLFLFISIPVPLTGYNVKNMVFLILYICFNPCAPPRGATVNANGKCVSASVRVKIDFYRRFFINSFDDLQKSTICIMKTLLYFVLFSFWLTWERARKLCCIFIKEGWWAVWKVISENTGRTP